MTTNSKKELVNMCISQIQSQDITNVSLRLEGAGNAEKYINRGCVYKKFLDLYGFLEISGITDGNRYPTVLTPGFIEHLGVSTEELFKTALDNLNGKDYIKDLNQLLRELMEGLSEDLVENTIPMESEISMVVLTNEEKIRGSAQMFNTSALLRGCDMLSCDNIIILPSSVHECILIKDDCADANNLLDLVDFVNTTEVMPDEVLSDSIYGFRRGMEAPYIKGANLHERRSA